MSITDELMDCIRTANRSYEDARNPYNDREILHIPEEELLAIADRIDIAHKHAIGYVDDRDPETMAENGWVRLPVDADGVPIHVGDVMEGEKIGGGFGEPFEVVGYIMSNGELEPMDEHNCPRKRRYLRHHHKPTVEDVLEELLREYDRDDSELTNGEIIGRFAARLRLAGEAE